MMPTLSIITPTQGRAALERMLDSGVGQLRQGDEWLVVIDRHEMALRDEQAIVHRITPYPYQVRVLRHDAGCHDWGHSQINHGMRRATGQYLTFLDDDDRVCPGALDAIRDAIAALRRPGPLLFRFLANFGRVVWQKEGVIAPGMVGGHCLVVPNVPDLLGVWDSSYEGDYAFVNETLEHWGRVGVLPVWVDRLIYRQRDQ